MAAAVMLRREVCNVCETTNEGVNEPIIVTMRCSHAYCLTCLKDKVRSKTQCHIKDCNKDFLTNSLVTFVNIHYIVSMASSPQ